MLQGFTCHGCGLSLSEESEEPRRPCPECGSSVRVAAELVQDVMVAYEDWRIEGRHAGNSRWFFQERSESSYFHRDAEWHRLFRLIDRQNDRYAEVITRRTTGEILREVEEPLSSHRGHGSAKLRQPDRA